MSIKVEIDDAKLKRMNQILAGFPGESDKAVKDALSRAVSRLRSSTVKAIKEKYDISAEAVRANQNVSIRYDYKNGVTAFVNFAGHKIPLYRYGGASPKEPKQDTGRLISAKIMGRWVRTHPGIAASGHQLKGTPVTQFDSAFVAKMKSGHIGIFKRTGGVTSEGSDEIREIMGSSVPQMLGNEEVQEQLAEAAMEKFQERLEDNINRIMTGSWR